MKSRRLVFSVIALIVGIALPSASSYAALTPVPAPSAPANVMAWANNQTVRVTWEPPVIAMAYTLSNYQINVYQDSHLLEMVQFAAPATEKVITGLPNYHTYTLTVQATQSTVGPNPSESSWSVASAASNPVIPPGGDPAFAASQSQRIRQQLGGPGDVDGAFQRERHGDLSGNGVQSREYRLLRGPAPSHGVGLTGRGMVPESGERADLPVYRRGSQRHGMGTGVRTDGGNLADRGRDARPDPVLTRNR